MGLGCGCGKPCEVCEVVEIIENNGRLKERLRSLLDEDIFCDSWISKHGDLLTMAKMDDDKLEDIRLKLAYINDKLWGMWDLLYRVYDE